MVTFFRAVTAAAVLIVPLGAVAAPDKSNASARAQEVARHWTAERLSTAEPRDLVLDERGLAYLKGKSGKLTPYGHAVAAQASDKEARAKPSGGVSDTSPPDFDNLVPAEGQVIGASQAFSAKVTDPSGIRSVTFSITNPAGQSQTFTPTRTGSTYISNLQGFSDGNWSWQVRATDGAKRGGNAGASDVVNFEVDTGGGGSGGGGGNPDVIENAAWLTAGPVQTAAGRIYFEMPNKPLRRKRVSWNGYVCSGTVVKDSVAERAIILTAAHCVYDDVNKAFARNVLFIPDQDQTTGSGTDTNCTNDSLGCWMPDFGVVDVDWTTSTFPDNIPVDYAYYVVPDTAAHTQGLAANTPEALEAAAGSMAISFGAPALGDKTHALGYSYSDDPNFMYCAEAMTTEGSFNWWLPSCGLSGGSSGGPWTQSTDADLGAGPVMSVNSWGYTTSPGMAGPKLNGTTAECLFNLAKDSDLFVNPAADGSAGYVGC